MNTIINHTKTIALIIAIVLVNVIHWTPFIAITAIVTTQPINYKRTRNLTNRHPCRIINRLNVYHPRPKYHKRKIKKLYYDCHVATLRNRRVSVYHRTVHDPIDCLSYYFRSKTPKRQLVYKRRSLHHKYPMLLVLSDRSISVVQLRARHVHRKRRTKSTFNRKLQFYKNRWTNRYRTKTPKYLTRLLPTK